MVKNKLVSTPVARKPASGLLKGMMANAIPQQSSVSRREGHALPVQRISGSDHASGEGYGIDMTNAPVPPRSYTADGCAVIHNADDVQIIFTQTCIFGKDIEAALIIRVNPIAIMNMASSFRDLVNPTVDDILAIIKAKPVPLVEISSKPRQVVNMTANLCYTAIAGHEASLEFFHSSAFAVRKSENKDEIEVEPVVRVELRTTVFGPLLDRILELDAEFQEHKGV